MTQFVDADGRKWEIEVSVPAIKRVRQRLDGVELLDLIDPQSSLMSRLFSDPCFLCDVLFVLCSPEAEKRNVTDEDFGLRIARRRAGFGHGSLVAGDRRFFPPAAEGGPDGVADEDADVPGAADGGGRCESQEPGNGGGNGEGISKGRRVYELCLQLAGVVGIDPFAGPGLTLRELLAMADARKRHEWDQTAELCAGDRQLESVPRRGRQAGRSVAVQPVRASRPREEGRAKAEDEAAKSFGERLEVDVLRRRGRGDRGWERLTSGLAGRSWR